MKVAESSFSWLKLFLIFNGGQSMLFLVWDPFHFLVTLNEHMTLWAFHEHGFLQQQGHIRSNRLRRAWNMLLECTLPDRFDTITFFAFLKLNGIFGVNTGTWCILSLSGQQIPAWFTTRFLDSHSFSPIFQFSCLWWNEKKTERPVTTHFNISVMIWRYFGCERELLEL